MMIVKKEVLIVRRVIQLKNDVHVCQINFFDKENCNVHVVMNHVIFDWSLIPQKTFFFIS